MKSSIWAGDFVTIRYNNGIVLEHQKVLYIPQNVGDMWHFNDIDGNVWYQNPSSSNLNTIILER